MSFIIGKSASPIKKNILEDIGNKKDSLQDINLKRKAMSSVAQMMKNRERNDD